jgi:hypothetical protein
VIHHHEAVFRVFDEERVVTIPLVGRGAGALLAEDLGQASIERNGRGRHTRVLQETAA